MSETPLHADTPQGPPKPPGRLLFARHQDMWRSILEENAVLRITALSSLLATILCLGYLATQGDRTRTLVIPFATGSQQLWITGDTPSDDYVRAIARNTISLLGTFTADSVEQQYNELLTHVHPSVYDQIRADWRGLAEEMVRYKEVSFATYIRSNEPILVRPAAVIVPARRIRFIGRLKTEEQGDVEIGYVVENGRFWLTSYNFIVQGGERVSTSD